MGMFWWIPFGKVPEITAEELDAMRKDGKAQIHLERRRRARS